jgi:aminoethylphosphonate catabolism LysR family transcriptional regulator
MTPAQARAFQAVALEGSFTAAARSLRVSQPTVTNQVKQLEQHYRVELFHRSGRGVLLTRTGEELLSIVRRMFGSYREAVEYLQASQGMRRGHLRLGSYGPYDASRMLARFKKRFPAIQSSISFGNSRVLGKQLLEYELDVGVVGRIEYHPEFHILPFSRPPLILIAPADGAWPATGTVTAARLDGTPFICRESGSAVRVAFDQFLAATEVRPGDIIEIGSREGMVNAVAEGLGVAVMFDEGPLPRERVAKLAIEGCDIRTDVDVVCLAERRESPIINNFLQIAQELIVEG